jgi:hypothetical protein
MSDQSTHPDEPGREPDPAATAQPAPDPEPKAEESTAEIPQRGPGAGAPRSWAPGPMPGSVRGAVRSRGMLAIATGLVGLMIGVLIGALGVVFVAAIARHVHAHHGDGFRGDNRGNFRRDDRPRPPFIQPGQLNSASPASPPR